MRKIIGLVVAIIAVCAGVPLLGAAAIFGGGGANCAPGATPVSAPASPGQLPTVDGWDAEQVSHAGIIVSVGNSKGVPPWGWVVAVATAMQESSLRNLPGGDRDSIGLFQQRPSQGWGTPEQLADPAYQAGKLFDKLLAVQGWQQMPLTDAAQAVQRSAAPDSYAKWTNDATRLVSAVGFASWRAIPEDLEQCLSNCPPILSNAPADLGSPKTATSKPGSSSDAAARRLLKISRQAGARIARNGQGFTLRFARQFAEPTQHAIYGPSPAVTIGPDQCGGAPSQSGWIAPVLAPVISGFHTPERPTHNGVDLAAPRGTIIRAAASGTVLTLRCNVNPASHGCDQDGSPDVKGCGWYVDLQHAAGVITRYCHLQAQPFVHEGQSVVVGQPLGLVGSSGHSSGPHLHYEVHLNHDQTAAGAVDPVAFMREVGAPLGTSNS